MRILIFGVTGMLGHAIWLNLRNICETFGTMRGDLVELSRKCSLFDKNDKKIIDKNDVLSDLDLQRALDTAKADVVVNCVGIVKQLQDAKYPIPSISINALFPHKLAEMCAKRNARLIHISTDCVFSGKKGNYRESDISDASDLYGRTKFLGEVIGNNCLTIRTSIVGRQLTGTSGLFEWFLSQNGKVHGYQKAIFSGLTTYSLAEIIRVLIKDYPTMDGLYHISSKPINKYDLLKRLKTTLHLDIGIIPDDSIVIDRSLDSTKFRELTHIKIPTLDTMIRDFAQRVSDYENWRY